MSKYRTNIYRKGDFVIINDKEGSMALHVSNVSIIWVPEAEIGIRVEGFDEPLFPNHENLKGKDLFNYLVKCISGEEDAS